MAPDVSAYIQLIGSITHWHGNVDAIDHAFILPALLHEFVFTAILEDQRKKRS